MVQETPLVLSRPNRWTRTSEGAAKAHDAEKSKRLQGSVLTIQVLLPELSDEEVMAALDEHNGDPDATLQALLGEEPQVTSKEEPKLQDPDDDADMAAAIAAAAAAEEEEAAALEAAKQASLRPPKSTEVQPPQVAPAEPEKPAAPAVPSWLPMMPKSPDAGYPGSGGTESLPKKKTMYDKQTDRLKAALGPSPTVREHVPSSHDSEFRGNAGKGGG
mmetsp:Transcript_90203/g.160662  ORF Transcript_90203/g.160662 Transcript_90203/m.160662 type:complete len:217 (+) Transcript_90203:34-684(+)